MSEKSNDKWLDLSAAAAKANCSYSTMHRHLKSPDSPLVFTRVGVKKGFRVSEASLEEMLRRRASYPQI